MRKAHKAHNTFILTGILISTLLLSACSFSFNFGDMVSVDEIDEIEPIPDAMTQLLPTNWTLIEEDTETITFHAEIKNATSGNMLSAYLVTPNIKANDSSNSFPTVMLIPGGTSFGTTAYGKKNLTSDLLIENEIAYAYFDPDGRGESEGEINGGNGFTDQNGLLAVSQALALHPSVDTEEMGILSMSYGTTLASGMLGRYPKESPYEWYIDWEGPSSREYTTVGCEPNKNVSQVINIKCTNEEFWVERESVTYLKTIEIPYLRLQSEEDHVQTSNEHAIDAINAALESNSPWIRINEEEINQSYTYENQPEYPEKIFETEYIFEMFELF